MSQRREKRLRQMEKRITALEALAATPTFIQKVDFMDAPYIPAAPSPHRGFLRCMADFFHKTVLKVGESGK